jgi:thiamine transporter ThiT
MIPIVIAAFVFGFLAGIVAGVVLISILVVSGENDHSQQVSLDRGD